MENNYIIQYYNIIMFSPNPEDHLQRVDKNTSDKSITRIEREHEMKIEDIKVDNEL